MKSDKSYYYILAWVAVAVFILFVGYAFIEYQANNKLDVNILLLMFGPVGLLIFIIGNFLKQENNSEEIVELKKEREEIKQKIGVAQPDIFQVIQLSLNQVNEYYTINKAQARKSFSLSVVALIIGLATIVIGVWLRYLKKIDLELSFITGFAGMLSEFIGATYFFMYKKSLEQVNFFFAQLIKIQDTMLAINIAQNVEDIAKKIELSEKIISSLLERSLK